MMSHPLIISQNENALILKLSSGSDLKAFDGLRNEGFTPEALRRIEESKREDDFKI